MSRGPTGPYYLNEGVSAYGIVTVLPSRCVSEYSGA